jgi:hypothetical protein
LLNKKRVHNLLLLEFTSLGPTIANLQKKNKHTNFLLTCPSLIAANLKQKNATLKLDVKQKASVETSYCHNLEAQV